MDLRPEVEWAGQAATPGTRASQVAQSALQQLCPHQRWTLTNPGSATADASSPAPTPVVIASGAGERPSTGLCIKLYPNNDRGVRHMRRHGRLLEGLHGVILVPKVVDTVSSADRFGFPALITTAIGDPLADLIHRVPVDDRTAIVERYAAATAHLHRVDPDRFPISKRYEKPKLLAQWREDSEEYLRKSAKAQGAAELVVTAARALAACDHAPDGASLVHRDLIPQNVMMSSGTFSGIVDWDHAIRAPAEEDVALAIVGLLILSSTPPPERIRLCRVFLRAYADELKAHEERLFAACVPFALTVLLDWLVGGKNAPRQVLAWAVERFLTRSLV